MSRLLLMFVFVIGIILPVYAFDMPLSVKDQWQNEITLGEKAVYSQDYDNAELHFNAAINIATSNKLEAIDFRVIPMNYLIAINDQQDRLDKAKQLAVETMSIIEKAGNPPSLCVAHTARLFGRIYLLQNDFDKAFPLFKKAMNE